MPDKWQEASLFTKCWAASQARFSQNCALASSAGLLARASYDRRHATAVRSATTTRAEQAAEAEGERGSRRKRRRTGEDEKRQQTSSSSAPGAAASPQEEQRPKKQQQQPQAKQSTSRADQAAEAEGERGSKRKRRRTAVIGEIPQNMRRALELWMLDRRTQATRTDPEVSQELCENSGDCSEDTSDDSSHNSSECNEADADCALALCDAATACRDTSCEEVMSMSDTSSDMSEQESDAHDVVFSGATEFPPEVAAEGSRRSGHGRTGVRGIVSVKDRSYGACRKIGIFGLESRVVPDLATALDHLAIITVLKQRAQHGVLDGDNFEDCMRRAFVETESEVGVEAMEDLGLKFFLSLSKSYWIGCINLVTPRITCLETALVYGRQFAELQQELSHRGVVRHGLLNRVSIADLEDNWHRFSALYIEACCGVGEAANLDASLPKSREAVAKRLAALVEANSAHREKQLRAWNCRHMLQEERLQRQVARTERDALLRDARTERLEAKKLANQEGAAEGLELSTYAAGGAAAETGSADGDRGGARRRKLPSELVQNLVRRWERLQSRLQSQRRRQAAAVLQQELAKQRAATLSNKEFAKQRSAARVELRRCRAEREERWRWMNRRDLTMADMLREGRQQISRERNARRKHTRAYYGAKGCQEMLAPKVAPLPTVEEVYKAQFDRMYQSSSLPALPSTPAPAKAQATLPQPPKNSRSRPPLCAASLGLAASASAAALNSTSRSAAAKFGATARSSHSRAGSQRSSRELLFFNDSNLTHCPPTPSYRSSMSGGSSAIWLEVEKAVQAEVAKVVKPLQEQLICATE
ncbi:unnamed protein product, partial [Polarella glacialis]